VRTPPLILIADDNPTNRDILQARLATQGYEIIAAADGEEALELAARHQPDLLLLDVMMPKLDGLEVCRRLKGDASLPFMPIIMVTARADSRDVVAGLEAGADEYLTKPVDQAALVARVRSMLRIKTLHDTAQQQAQRLEAQSAELAGWNQELEARVAQQVEDIERLSQLQRFLSPQIAEAIVSSPQALEPHRREITVCFCDLRGFTAFAETAEPEDLMSVLRDYHAAMGELIFRFEGTLEHFAGDGMMVFFNDPLPCDDPAGHAVQMAIAMRERAAGLAAGWRRRGHQLGFGMGIAMGYATLGRIGFEGRFDYGAIGSVTNVAARLCGEAAAGHILVTERVCMAVEDHIALESIGDLELRGLRRAEAAYNVVGLKQPRPAHSS
jgi:class 3 adenylate cyclase